MPDDEEPRGAGGGPREVGAPEGRGDQGEANDDEAPAQHAGGHSRARAMRRASGRDSARSLRRREAMHVETFVDAPTLERLVRQLAPVRIHMTPPEEQERWVELEEPSLCELVPERGLRVVTRGRFRIRLAGFAPTFRIRRVQLVLEPLVRVRDDRAELAFAIELEGGDVARVPRFLDRRIVARVNAALTPKDTRLVWGFAETLSGSFGLTPRLEPLDRFEVEAGRGKVEVSEDGVRFRVGLDPELTRAGALDPGGDLEGPGEPRPATSELLLPRVAMETALEV